MSRLPGISAIIGARFRPKTYQPNLETVVMILILLLLSPFVSLHCTHVKQCCAALGKGKLK